MNMTRVVMLSFLLSVVSSSYAEGYSANNFEGFYLGLEGGPISYNTQITFDGVDDPAGRGGLGYGGFIGYNFIHERYLIGAELLVGFAPDPDPYTFDPAIVGFADLELRRDRTIGLDSRVGFRALNRVILLGTVGFSRHKQSVYVDDIALEQYASGAGVKEFGRIQLGLGLEIALTSKFGFRFLFRTFDGHDLDKRQFDAIPAVAALNRFDVEPSVQQFSFGLRLII